MDSSSNTKCHGKQLACVGGDKQNLAIDRDIEFSVIIVSYYIYLGTDCKIQITSLLTVFTSKTIIFTSKFSDFFFNLFILTFFLNFFLQVKKKKGGSYVQEIKVKVI